ncbi:MAG: NAD(P)/FAD-dependent oxidoreductase [Pelagimonas sp.]|nr:NAD(P)/FAD-dependent oxidoreductase [Pelagimonas sp.]
MAGQTVDTLVVGAGQAGIAMSEHLRNNAVPHLVLERARIAERWRTGRWDSLVANGPAWHDRFPGMEFTDHDPDAFVPKDRVAQYFEDYARMIDAPVRCGVSVEKAEPLQGRPGFRVTTSDGVIEAQRIVAATGAFQKPVIPPVLPQDCALHQIHSFNYRNPDQLPKGGVIVVGAGSSGVQIAEELNRAGRKVYLSVGPHDRPPRRYRGRDNVWWLGVLGLWEARSMQPGKERHTICVSGAHGGETVDFRDLAGQGVTLVGMTDSYQDGVLRFASDLEDNIRGGDATYLAMLDQADAYAERNGLDLPDDPQARVFAPMPECVTNPLAQLDLAAEGVTSVIWATGFSQDFSWLPAAALDDQGRPRHDRGVCVEPDIYFLGLPWQSCRGSSFIWGVWQDAKHVGEHIAARRHYLSYGGQARKVVREPA